MGGGPNIREGRECYHEPAARSATLARAGPANSGFYGKYGSHDERQRPGPACPFSCTYSVDFPDILLDLGASLALSTYQSGKVILLSPAAEPDRPAAAQLPRTRWASRWTDRRLAIATRDAVVVLADSPELAASLPRKPGVYDSLYVPRATYNTGPMAIHDMAWGTGRPALRGEHGVLVPGGDRGPLQLHAGVEAALHQPAGSPSTIAT